MAGIKRILVERKGVMFTKDSVDLYIADMIVAGNFFERKDRSMANDIEAVTKETEGAVERLGVVLDRFRATEEKFTAQAKSASGAVRDAGDKIAQGIKRVESAANFDRLERYVGLLERAALAMEALAELESTGKLEKIAGAIR